ncbi:MAG: ABC transporter substrate-binding protein, partial [Actinobacteria bacterium]|nr:ABC transporter substrate-binding protein [Actinomycetota bacterium]
EFSVYICEPEALTPTRTNEVCGAEVLNALFSGLVEYDAETSEPLLGGDSDRAVAESIESDDQQAWTITLKEGFTFHDGTAVTAQSFADSWNYGASGPNAQDNSYFFANIEGYEDVQCGTSDEGEADCEASPPAAEEMSGLEVVDDQTLEVTLAEPFSQFPLTVGYTAFYPMAEAFFDDPEAANEAPIGNGPFQMDGEWEHNQAINVVAYDDHPAPPNVDAIEFGIYADINTAYNDLLAGNLDVMDNLPPEQIESAQAEFGDRFIDAQSSAHTFVGLPTYDERFESVELRQAISKAIDRQAITDTVKPDETPAFSVVGPVVQGARENPCGDNCEYDPEAARDLLEEAGGWEGPLTLWFNAGGGHDVWMEAVAN